MTSLPSSENRRFLIRHCDFIIGPMSESEIRTELKEGRFSHFTMACLPYQECWLFLANYPEFSEIDTEKIKDLPNKEAPSSKITTTPQTVSAYQTVTLSKDSIDSLLGETTRKVLRNKTITEELISSGEVQELPYTHIEGKSIPSGSPKIEEKTQKWTSLAGILIGILVAAGILLKFFSDQTPILERKFLTQVGLNYFRSGMYEHAIQKFKEVQKKSQLNKESLFLFRISQLQLHGDIYEGQKILESDSAKDLSPDITKMIENLIKIKTGDLGEVADSFSEIAKMSKTTDVKLAALANLVLLSARNGECRKLDRYRQESLSIDKTNNHLLNFMFSNCILLSKKASKKQMKEAQEILETMSQKSQSYYQESLLGLAYLHDKKNQPEKTLSLIQKLLDSNPRATNNYQYSIFIDKQIFSWPQMIPLCKSLYKSQENNGFYVALYAYCLAHSDNQQSALPLIQKANVIDSSNTLIKATNSFINSLLNLTNESLLLLSDSIKSNIGNQYQLPYILEAQMCEKNQDWQCAVKNWLLVLNKNPNSLSALGGMAYSKYQQRLYEEAEEYTRRGKKQDREGKYGPLSFVNLELEVQ